jgi:E3 ubiquitin-protein ligase UBR2
MDKVTRQVGQHVEFDPEWETAFNLVIKIQSILSSILDWCSHDVSKTNQKIQKRIDFF